MNPNPEEEEEIATENMYATDEVDPLADPLALDDELVDRTVESGQELMADGTAELDHSDDGQIILVDVNSFRNFGESDTFEVVEETEAIHPNVNLIDISSVDVEVNLQGASADDGIGVSFEPIALSLDDEINEEIEGARSDGSDSGLGLEISTTTISDKNCSIGKCEIGWLSSMTLTDFHNHFADSTMTSTPTTATANTPTAIVSANEVDLISTNTTSLVSPSLMPSFRSNLKRRSDPGDQIDAIEVKKSKRNIQFSNVTVYYFPRIQGFTCIPSQGGCTLGMGPHHYDQKTFTLSEHNTEQKRLHRLRLLEQKPRSLLGLGLPTPPSTLPSSIVNDTSMAANSLSAMAPTTTANATDERSRSSTEESDSEEDVLSDNSSSEFDADSGGFLQPVPQRQRRALLKAAGIREIASFEKNECRDIRLSREFCGCNCRDYCDPETCFCSQSGIKCQVDRASFPCGCTQDGCGNVFGRIEFNPKRVRTHFIHTIMRLELEKKQKKSDKQNSLNTYDGRLRLRDSDDDCSQMSNVNVIAPHRTTNLGQFVGYSPSSSLIYSSTMAMTSTVHDTIDGAHNAFGSSTNRTGTTAMAESPLDLHYAYRHDYQMDLATNSEQPTSAYSIYGNSPYFQSTSSLPFDDFTGLAQSSQPPEITTPYSSYSSSITAYGTGLVNNAPSIDLIDSVSTSCSYMNTYDGETRDLSLTNGLFDNTHEEINVLPLAPTLQFNTNPGDQSDSATLNRIGDFDGSSTNLLESTTELKRLLQTPTTTSDEDTFNLIVASDSCDSEVVPETIGNESADKNSNQFDEINANKTIGMAKPKSESTISREIEVSESVTGHSETIVENEIIPQNAAEFVPV